MNIKNTETDKNSDASGSLALDGAYWDNRYISDLSAWDLGEVSPPIKAYIDQVTNKDQRILIPGCGNTYEAEYLLQNGFTNITVIDIAPALVEKLKMKFAVYPQINIVLGDFFNHQGQYDLILEQTFFCALNPLLRKDYVAKMKELLVAGGKLVGVLFNYEFELQGPPFGGLKDEYEPMFANEFAFEKFEPCYNSFVKRAGTELFVNLVKK
jgi:SAM-dependent methyltransferase